MSDLTFPVRPMSEIPVEVFPGIRSYRVFAVYDDGKSRSIVLFSDSEENLKTELGLAQYQPTDPITIYVA